LFGGGDSDVVFVWVHHMCHVADKLSDQGIQNQWVTFLDRVDKESTLLLEGLLT
jgi:hypothetical protein